jgi:diaminohydroxyphosphoribosylaminopyrimidine deaminase/5-amino-6-(5-phosphoribosylamino)uracil reductase
VTESQISAPETLALMRAINLARSARGDVEPNPPVGALVLAEATVVGEGWHRAYGGAHAEVDALDDAGEAARGATLVVTLEPCSTTGKTPPCVEAILKAGIVRVVVGALDPDPRHGGRGLEVLRAAGLEVLCCEDPQSTALIAEFSAGLQRRRPHVMLKWAQSADGCIAGPDGEPLQLTGSAATARVHRWRGQLDGILVGVQTVLNDDPMLTARGLSPALRPLRRIVLDRSLRMPITSRLADTAGETPTWVMTQLDADQQPEVALDARDVRVLRVPEGPTWLADCLSLLAAEGVGRLMVEGGARTLSAFFDAGLVDQVAVFQCPQNIGPQGLPALPGRSLAGLSPEQLAEALELSDVRTEALGEDVLVRGVVQRSQPVTAG